MGTRAHSLMANGRALQRALCLIMLVTFTFQSFLIQTHIHLLPFGVATTSGQTASTQGDAKVPLDMDKCVLCQEYLHGGAYLTPQVAATLPPMVVISVVRFVIAPFILARAISHNWLGRAPPQA